MREKDVTISLKENPMNRCICGLGMLETNLQFQNWFGWTLICLSMGKNSLHCYKFVSIQLNLYRVMKNVV